MQKMTGKREIHAGTSGINGFGERERGERNERNERNERKVLGETGGTQVLDADVMPGSPREATKTHFRR